MKSLVSIARMFTSYLLYLQRRREFCYRHNTKHGVFKKNKLFQFQEIIIHSCNYVDMKYKTIDFQCESGHTCPFHAFYS